MLASIWMVLRQNSYLQSVEGSEPVRPDSESPNSELARRDHEQLHIICRKILSAMDVQEIYDVTGKALADSFELPFIFIDVLDEDETMKRVAIYPEDLKTEGQRFNFELAWEVVKSGVTQYHTGLQQETEEKFKPFIDQNVNTLLALPLGTEGYSWGVLLLADVEDQAFHQHTIDNFKLVTEFLSLAVERRLDVEALRMSEGRSRSIVNTALDAIITIEEKGLVTSINPAFEDLFGHYAEDVLGFNVSMLMPEPDSSQHDAYIKRYLETGQRRIMGLTREVMAIRRNGETFPAEITISELVQGKERMFTGIIRDITDRRKMEEELEQAREQAEEAMLSKNRFLANLSHEIRSPMNGVQGMANLLLETRLTGEQQEYATAIIEAGDALISVINDILDYSRTEAGNLDLEHRDFDLRHCLESVGDLMAIKAQEKKLELITWFENGIPTQVIGDQNRLRQVLVNLVGNAIKYTKTGKVTARCSMVDLSDQQVAVKVEVIDTGIGIATADRENLFKMFSQKGASQNSAKGFGLSISKNLIELMGGKLELHSTPHKGSNFYFTLKLARQQHGSAEPVLDLSRYRCLVLEGCEETGEALTELAFFTGCRFQRVQGAEEALTALKSAHDQQDPFHLLVFSYQPENAESTGLVTEIKNHPHIANTALILMATHPQHAQAMELLEMGVHHCLLKPVKQRIFLEAICSCLGLPFAAAKTHASQPDHSPAATGLVRVLVVEDQTINQNLTCRLLEKKGYRWTLAQNGEEAVEKFDTQTFDIILMDCQMPIMDGLEATAKIREKEEPPGRIPIIAMTAGAMKEDRERCIAAGMDDYLCKPVQAADLYDLLNKQLNKE